MLNLTIANEREVQVLNVNEIRPFTHDELGEIRVMLLNEQPFFNLADIGFTLGQTKIAKGNLYLRKERITKWCETLDVTGLSINGQQLEITKEIDFDVIFISEEDMYDLLLESGTAQARPLRRWIAREVLPQIRKTGSYGIQPQLPSNYKEALLALVVAEEEKEQLKLVAEENATVVSVLFNTIGLMPVTSTGKLLKLCGVDTSYSKITKELREIGAFKDRNKGNNFDHNTPYSDYEKYFAMRFVTTKSGRSVKRTFFNEKGLRWYLKRLYKEGRLNGLKVDDLIGHIKIELANSNEQFDEEE